ncbi:auxin-responsive family protein, partial [Striga asiatica]
MLKPVLIIFIIFSLYTASTAQSSCSTHTFPSNQIFSTCIDLPILNSHLHWNYDTSARTLNIAYRHTGISPSRWIAWALNPTGQGMVGAQALVAHQRPDGSMRAYTSPVTSYQTRLQEGNLGFPVSDLSATYSEGEMVIFATLRLDNFSLGGKVNQVWQEGPVSGGFPGMHQTTGANMQSVGSLDLLSGSIHGVLNAISWGLLLPIGAIFARYLKVFPWADPAWFYLHATCQTSAYIIGVAGWATGLRLGSQSSGVQYTAHRIIGIVIFCLGTLQVTALLLRPKKEHKHRIYWNVYHHTIGYSVIILSIINIFKGFDILNPAEKWKRAYVGILIGLAFLGAILEAYTWCVVLKRKKSSRSQKMANGGNAYSGYGASRAHEYR